MWLCGLMRLLVWNIIVNKMDVDSKFWPSPALWLCWMDGGSKLNWSVCSRVAFSGRTFCLVEVESRQKPYQHDTVCAPLCVRLCTVCLFMHICWCVCIVWVCVWVLTHVCVDMQIFPVWLVCHRCRCCRWQSRTRARTSQMIPTLVNVGLWALMWYLWSRLKSQT